MSETGILCYIRSVVKIMIRTFIIMIIMKSLICSSDRGNRIDPMLYVLDRMEPEC